MKNEQDSKSPANPPLPPATGSAAGPSKWEIWPLLMALGFICMAKNNSMGELYLRALTIVALTYSISHRLCRRQNDQALPPGDSK